MTSILQFANKWMNCEVNFLNDYFVSNYPGHEQIYIYLPHLTKIKK